MSEVRDYTRGYLARAEVELERAIARAGIMVQAEARRLTHQAVFPPASAPGSPPHVRTATLTRSIDQENLRTPGGFTARVGTNVQYGRFLELGTRTMAARPYLRPALDGNRARILQMIRQAIRQVLR